MDPLIQRVAARYLARQITADDPNGLYHTRMVDTPKLERLLAVVGRELHQMNVSLGQYKHDPRKYEPQLENLTNSATTAMAALNVVLRNV